MNSSDSQSVTVKLKMPPSKIEIPSSKIEELPNKSEYLPEKNATKSQESLKMQRGHLPKTQ